MLNAKKLCASEVLCFQSMGSNLKSASVCSALGKQQTRKIENQTGLRPAEVRPDLLSRRHPHNKTGFLHMNKTTRGHCLVPFFCFFNRETEVERRRILYDPEELREHKKEREKHKEERERERESQKVGERQKK